MAPSPCLTALATALPPFVFDQDDVMCRAQRLFATNGSDIERMLPVYGNAGVETRHSCVPLDWYMKDTGWKERNGLYVTHAIDLLEEAAQRCLADVGVRAEAVDCLVVASTSGIATPSLDAQLMARLPFRRDVQRLPIFGLGCAGGTLGLARAAAMAQAEPEALVLFLVVELCGLTFRSDDGSKSNIIATALFGDGAAAALVTCRDDVAGRARLAAWGEHTWPDSLEVMGWRLEDNGLGVLFSRDIPSIVRQHYRDAVDAFLEREGTSVPALSGHICHPGGAKVVQALEAALEAPPGTMDDAREVLRTCGNMSAATVLFVLERTLARGAVGRHLMSSLGPGFTAGFLLMELMPG